MAESHFQLFNGVVNEGHLAKLTSVSEFRVLWALFTFRNSDSGLAWPSIQTLAKFAEVNERSTYYALKSLTKKGFICTVTKGGGRRRSTVRKLLLPGNGNPESNGHGSADIETLQDVNMKPCKSRAENPASQGRKPCKQRADEPSINQLKNQPKNQLGGFVLANKGEINDDGYGESADYLIDLGVNQKLVLDTERSLGVGLINRVVAVAKERQCDPTVRDLAALLADLLRHPKKIDQHEQRIDQDRRKKLEEEDDSHTLDEEILHNGKSYGEVLRTQRTKQLSKKNGFDVTDFPRPGDQNYEISDPHADDGIPRVMHGED